MRRAQVNRQLPSELPKRPNCSIFGRGANGHEPFQTLPRIPSLVTVEPPHSRRWGIVSSKSVQNPPLLDPSFPVLESGLWHLTPRHRDRPPAPAARGTSHSAKACSWRRSVAHPFLAHLSSPSLSRSCDPARPDRTRGRDTKSRRVSSHKRAESPNSNQTLRRNSCKKHLHCWLAQPPVDLQAWPQAVPTSSLVGGPSPVPSGSRQNKQNTASLAIQRKPKRRRELGSPMFGVTVHMIRRARGPRAATSNLRPSFG